MRKITIGVLKAIKNFLTTPMVFFDYFLIFGMFFAAIIESISYAERMDDKQPKFATMNLSKVVALQEASLTMKGLKGDELDREAKVFALSLQDSIKQIQDDCKCTLLVSSAVIGDHKLDDYTDDLIARLKLDPRAGDIVRGFYEMNLTRKTGA